MRRLRCSSNNDCQRITKHQTGMKLDVTHRTAFHYSGRVRESENTLHLEPRDFRTQRTLRSLIRVVPATRLLRFQDLFQNVTHQFELPQPHDRLVVESRIRVETTVIELSPEALQVKYPEAIRHWATEETWQFLQESRHVSKHPDIWRAALERIEDHPCIHDQALAIMDWIHREFTYAPGSTDVDTHLEQAFAQRRGVCQDYAHVMIGMCRSIGIPARYVSGYLYNGPRDHLIGNQASHAWVEIHLPHAGWVGYDPTNNTVADERFVKIAVGRDYQDVSPIQGSYMGSAHCRLEVRVKVERI
jgi:transglutaminase-like putative cysteine protease